MQQPELKLAARLSAQRPKRNAAVWLTSIHEAGHAVVAVYYKLPIIEACVQGGGDGFVLLDQEQIEPLLYTANATRSISAQAVMGYAGFAATHRLKPGAALRWESGVDDWETNNLWLWWLWDNVLSKRCPARRHALMTDAQIEHQLARRARRLFLIARRLVHGLFPVIQIVARALYERRRLAGAEVVALAGPLIANLRPDLVVRPVGGHDDYHFRIHPYAARMPRPESYEPLGLRAGGD